MINDLIVRGDPPQVASLIERLENVPTNGWMREPDLEQRLKQVGASPWGVFCFGRPGVVGKPAAVLLLQSRGLGELSIANIFPKETASLSDEEFNEIIEDFRRDILDPASSGIEVETIVIPPLRRLESTLSPEALRRLRSFSSAANKEIPHPLDWRRWDEFLVQVHQDDLLLDEFDLAFWLASQGWTEPQFSRFLERFRAGQSLLAVYDEGRLAR